MKTIAYYRVSTQKQGQSGLGMADQRAMMETFVKNGGHDLIATFEETESGKRADRPQLAKALALAKMTGATLVIAKLDRLARNVAFLSSLMESGAEFVAIDNPHATRLTTHILAAVAEDEARRISERTKGGLRTIKRIIATNGFYISKAGNRINALGAARAGHWDDPDQAEKMKAGLAHGRQVAATAQKGTMPLTMLLPAMREMKANGMTVRAIAASLNEQGATTRLGNPWCGQTVWRALQPQTA